MCTIKAGLLQRLKRMTRRLDGVADGVAMVVNKELWLDRWGWNRF